MQKVILMVVAVVLMFSGGTVGVLKWMQLGPFAPPPSDEATETKPKPRSGGVARFVDIEPLNIAIIENNRPRAVLQISAKLEVGSEKEAAMVSRNMIRFTDAALRDLYDFLPRLLREADRLEISLLKDRLQLIADRIYGKGVVRQVLIQSVHDTSGKS
ncbi:MAG: hypothetical protein FJX42_00695 [Alphaproteobacteria bacterium]|nr:hypothetical protein [Alphaproteobacteria bacterium]